MLENALPPIELPQNWNVPELAQAFAVTKLASYATNPFPANVVQSFLRSYGMTIVAGITPAAAGSPGCAIGRVTYPWGKHIIIGFCGSQTTGQAFANFVLSRNMVNAGSPGGQIGQFIHDHVVTLGTALAAVPGLSADLALPSTQITYCGFSLGAGIAEVMAAVSKALAPTRKIRVRKFGACNVGNGTWIESRPDGLDVACIYRAGDGVWQIPWCTTIQQIAGPITAWSVLPSSYYALDPARQFRSWDGQMAAIPRRGFMDPEIAFSTQWLRPVTTSNPAYNHLIESYRLLIHNMLIGGGDVDYQRFRYLEFPGDRHWQWAVNRQEFFEPAWIADGAGDDSFFPNLVPDAQPLRLHGNVPPAPAAQQPAVMQRLPENFNVIAPEAAQRNRRSRHHPLGAP